MHKVLVEEGRGCPGNKFGRRKNLPEEQLPGKQGMRQPYVRRKWFGEHLGPLKRWLRSNVGRPWDKVYSEASWIMRPDNVVRAHIRFHMFQMVERNTFFENGQVWRYLDGGKAVRIQRAKGYRAWPFFYVHPVSGLLLEGGPELSRWRLAVEKDPKIERRWMAADWLFLGLGDKWFDCDVARFPESKLPDYVRAVFDAMHQRNISREEAREIYGKEVHATSARLLSVKELKRHGLAKQLSLPNVAVAKGRSQLSRPAGKFNWDLAAS